MSNKIHLDKYYTSTKLAKYVVDKTEEIIGRNNISQYLESSAGNGVFLDFLGDNYLAYDIEPEDIRIEGRDYLEINLPYKEGRCIIGNPPYGNRMNLARKFFKKSTELGDYISFILPISQLDNSNSLYEFDLIYSEDLGLREYSDRKLHCCFNIYKRPIGNELNNKPKNKLKDIDIIRQDSKSYIDSEFDIRMCYWGDGSAGKILKEGENYSGEYKIIINNKDKYDEIYNFITTFNWNEHIKGIAMVRIKQFQIIELLLKNIEGIE